MSDQGQDRDVTPATDTVAAQAFDPYQQTIDRLKARLAELDREIAMVEEARAQRERELLTHTIIQRELSAK